ncbi:hypothetical protein [Georgenia thermotolerans]|uniref:Uncharacterized protein n=1 Tax=Georgenia thermotolerans TaxID=527326 RepID=A0A7J5ULY1_9MICO|nr:hypothetical protein [Georgenia thermotolerans]KAE8762923.1 hypothetical protein GB883_16850 [Georgenia thermotolerans]
MDLWLQLHEYRAADLVREAEDAHRRRALPRAPRRTGAGVLLAWLAPRLARLEGPPRSGAETPRQAVAEGTRRRAAGRGTSVPCPAC